MRSGGLLIHISSSYSSHSVSLIYEAKEVVGVSDNLWWDVWVICIWYAFSMSKWYVGGNSGAWLWVVRMSLLIWVSVTRNTWEGYAQVDVQVYVNAEKCKSINMRWDTPKPHTSRHKHTHTYTILNNDIIYFNKYLTSSHSPSTYIPLSGSSLRVWFCVCIRFCVSVCMYGEEGREGEGKKRKGKGEFGDVSMRVEDMTDKFTS